MANAKLNWTNLQITENAPEAIKQAVVELEAARDMEKAALASIADALAASGRIAVPQGHEIKVSAAFGKLSFAIAPRAQRKAVSF